jgi:hypothetical protein
VKRGKTPGKPHSCDHGSRDSQPDVDGTSCYVGSLRAHGPSYHILRKKYGKAKTWTGGSVSTPGHLGGQRQPRPPRLGSLRAASPNLRKWGLCPFRHFGSIPESDLDAVPCLGNVQRRMERELRSSESGFRLADWWDNDYQAQIRKRLLAACWTRRRGSDAQDLVSETLLQTHMAMLASASDPIRDPVAFAMRVLRNVQLRSLRSGRLVFSDALDEEPASGRFFGQGIPGGSEYYAEADARRVISEARHLFSGCRQQQVLGALSQGRSPVLVLVEHGVAKKEARRIVIAMLLRWRQSAEKRIGKSHPR